MNYIEFNGEYVVEELINFYNKAKLKNPNLIGKPMDWRSLATLDKDKNPIRASTHMEIWHSNTSVGKLGYWGDKYYVHSRLIINDKFAHWNKTNYHSKSSVHMKNMIKVALDNLIPPTIKEIAKESNQKMDILEDIRRVSYSIRRESDIAFNKLSNDTLFEELLNMYSQGYKPKSNAVCDVIKFVVENKQKYEQNFNYKPDYMFVYIKEDNSVYTVDNKELVYGYSELNKLPEDILNKITVLMVSPEKTFIRDIGKKETNNKLWILI